MQARPMSPEPVRWPQRGARHGSSVSLPGDFLGVPASSVPTGIWRCKGGARFEDHRGPPFRPSVMSAGSGHRVFARAAPLAVMFCDLWCSLRSPWKRHLLHCPSDHAAFLPSLPAPCASPGLLRNHPIPCPWCPLCLLQIPPTQPRASKVQASTGAFHQGPQC